MNGQPTPILVDCDPGVDDALALLLALASPELELLGVTTVAGNQTLAKTTRNALRVLEAAGRADVPVAAGAERPLVRDLAVAADVHGESGLGDVAGVDPLGAPDPRHAVDLLAGLILTERRPVTLVAIGPLTNVALLAALRPEAAARIGRIVVMGGAIGLGNITPAAEFNVWTDPEAARRVLASGLDVTLVGLDVTNRILLGARDAGRLRRSGELGRFAADALAVYGRFHLEAHGRPAAPVHDAAAIAYVVDESLLATERANVEVDCGWELGRGRTYVDLRRRVASSPSVRVAVDVDAPRIVSLLVERLEALARRTR